MPPAPAPTAPIGPVQIWPRFFDQAQDTSQQLQDVQPTNRAAPSIVHREPGEP
jgi:hypothetical protein